MSDGDVVWDQWFEAMWAICQELDERVEKAIAGRSDQFAAAMYAGLMEHLTERLRFCLHLPATDEREAPMPP